MYLAWQLVPTVFFLFLFWKPAFQNNWHCFSRGGGWMPFLSPNKHHLMGTRSTNPPFPTTGLVLSSSISGLVRKEALIAFTLAAVQSVLNCKPLNCTLGRSLLSMITLLDLLHVAKVYFWSTFLQVIYTLCCPAPLWLMIEWKWVSVDSGEPL